MNMGRAHWVAIKQIDEFVRRTISRQRVSCRVKAVESVVAVLIGPELAAQVVGNLVLGVLEVVLAIGASLPNVEDGVRNGLLGNGVGDVAMHQRRSALVGRDSDRVAGLTEGSVRRPEGAENSRGGGLISTRLLEKLVLNFVNNSIANRLALIILP